MNKRLSKLLLDHQIQKKSFASKSSGEQNINIPIKQKFDHSKSQTLG